MPKILVPLDGSECALRGLAFATQRAKDSPGSSLHLLTVHHGPSSGGANSIYVGKERMERLASEHDEWVLRDAEETLSAAGVAYSTEAAEGDPSEVIAQCAKERGCDLIVMGTRGMGRIGTLLMGSVATKVVHLSTVPVTLVK